MLVVGDAGHLLEPAIDGVAPDDGVAGLVFEEAQNLAVALRIDEAVEGLPLRDETGRFLRAEVVIVVDRLDHGLAGVQV